VTKAKVASAPEAVLVSNKVFADTLGISTRTLWNWEARGILPPAKKIRKRKYWDPNVRPKLDGEAVA
jgi:DNA-binding transcriptional regulator YiaG